MEGNVYLFTVFIENLRRCISYTQQDLSNDYETVLTSEIETLQEEVCSKLKDITNSTNANIIGAKTKALFRALPVKKKIRLHELLANALDELNGSNGYSLSKSEFERYSYCISKYVNQVVNPDTAGAASSRGGTERRTVSDLLKPQRKPNEYALKFILTRCFAPKMIQKVNLSYIKENLFSSRHSIKTSLFCFGLSSRDCCSVISDTPQIDEVINTILQEKRKLFATNEPLTPNKRKEQQLEACRNLFLDIADKLLEVGQVPISLFTIIDDSEDIETYSIYIAQKAKTNLEVLVGKQAVEAVWNEIACTVYNLSLEVADLAESRLNESINLCADEITDILFYYRFYTTPEILGPISKYLTDNTF